MIQCILLTRKIGVIMIGMSQSTWSESSAQILYLTMQQYNNRFLLNSINHFVFGSASTIVDFWLARTQSSPPLFVRETIQIMVLYTLPTAGHQPTVNLEM